MVLWVLSIVAITLSVVALVYAELLNRRYESAVLLLNAMDKDRKELYGKVDDLDREMATARAAMEEWHEAGKMARKNEEDFNEGLNNIINYQPGVSKKGEKN